MFVQPKPCVANKVAADSHKKPTFYPLIETDV